MGMNERQRDGRNNYETDDRVEAALEEHFERFKITKREIWRNFQIYTRRTFLKRFIAHYEMFKKTIELPGDIVELGVYRGASLMSWANFLELRNMGDRHKRVIGFDGFSGFELKTKDGAPDPNAGKTEGGFDSSEFEEILRDAIRIFDADRFIPHKPRVVLVKGDIKTTVPKFVEENPGLRISLLHFDADLYEPTMTGLEHLWPLVVSGGIVLFDEYGIPPWEGESSAVDEFFKRDEEKKIELRRLDWSANPGAYVIKE